MNTLKLLAKTMNLDTYAFGPFSKHNFIKN